MKTVKVILREDLEGVGHRGDVVEVQKGYARNMLYPHELAMPSTPGAEAQGASMRKARDERDAAARESAEDIAKVMVSKVITISTRAGEGGRLFGSVTAAEIVEAVSEQAGIDLDRKAIRLDEHIKDTGSHNVMVRLHTDVEFPIRLDVQPA